MNALVRAALALAPLAILIAGCGGGDTNADGSGAGSTGGSAGNTGSSSGMATGGGGDGTGGGAGGSAGAGGASGRGAGYDRLGFFPCAADAKDQVACYKSLASWLGRPGSPPIPYVTLMTDASDPSIMAGNGWGYTVEPGSFQTLTPRPTLVISVPLAFKSDGCQFGTTSTTCFDPVANGSHDGDYTSLTTYFKSAGITDVIIRLGWEFDGNWMPWSAQNNFGQFKAAYRHVHDLMKGLMPSLKFDLCADSLSYDSTAAVMAIWDHAYPGDGYVDIFGMDVYYSPDQYPDFSQSYLPYLKLQEQFAHSKGLSVSYPEWGQKNMADDPTFINDMADWFDSLPTSGAGRLEYQSYFNQDTSADDGANGAVQLYNTITNQPTSPSSAAAFLTRFGGP